MDHAYVRRQTVDTPWRTAAIVAAGIAAVELFILIILGVAFGAKLTSDHAEKAVTNATAAAAPPAATSTETNKAKTKTNTAPTASLPRRRTSVIVLNGNGTPGAAAATAEQLRHF